LIRSNYLETSDSLDYLKDAKFENQESREYFKKYSEIIKELGNVINKNTGLKFSVPYFKQEVKINLIININIFFLKNFFLELYPCPLRPL